MLASLKLKPEVDFVELIVGQEGRYSRKTYRSREVEYAKYPTDRVALKIIETGST